MLTEREVIKMLERSLAMLEDRNKTQKEHDLSDDDFYPYMAGYLSEDIEFIITYLKRKIK